MSYRINVPEKLQSLQNRKYLMIIDVMRDIMTYLLEIHLPKLIGFFKYYQSYGGQRLSKTEGWG